VGGAFREGGGVGEKWRVVGPATVERVAFRGRSGTSGPSSAPATLAHAALGSPGECPRDPWGFPALRGVLIGGIRGAEAPVPTRPGRRRGAAPSLTHSPSTAANPAAAPPPPPPPLAHAPPA